MWMAQIDSHQKIFGFNKLQISDTLTQNSKMIEK